MSKISQNIIHRFLPAKMQNYRQFAGKAMSKFTTLQSTVQYIEYVHRTLKNEKTEKCFITFHKVVYVNICGKFMSISTWHIDKHIIFAWIKISFEIWHKNYACSYVS